MGQNRMMDAPLLPLLVFLVAQGAPTPLTAQTLPLPARRADALAGHQVVAAITSLSRSEREERLYQELTSGNVPEFLRQLVTVVSSATVAGEERTVTYYVTPDYLAVGSDSDYFLAPMTPLLGQRLADDLGCMLPTRLMVDQIYAAATCKLAPVPIPPSPEMITVPVFALHDSIVGAQRSAHLAPLGALVGGTKKDVVISNKIYHDLRPSVPRPVVIYGWHQLNGSPIQPLYNGHGEDYADYSHGIRLVQDTVLLDGEKLSLASLLRDPALSLLFSDEGVIPTPRYAVPATGFEELAPGGPEGSLLLPAYPNPFNPSTTIKLRLHEASRVRLRIVTALGETVAVLAEGVLSQGPHEYVWDGGGRPSGIYFCRLESETTSGRRLSAQTRGMVLVR